MRHIQIEPIVIRPRHGHAPHGHATHTHSAGSARPANVEALAQQIQREFPAAHIRITGRGRTAHRQAELMAQRRHANRSQFLETYIPAQHITEMDHWASTHQNATLAQMTAAFEQIIHAAVRRGARVSNHLSDRARDISIPLGGHAVQTQVRHRLESLGAHVIDEHEATGGAHWHVDY